MWKLTVLRLMCSSSAVISALALPCATVTATLSSRSVRGTIGCLGSGRRGVGEAGEQAGGDAGGDQGVALGRRPDGVDQQVGTGVLEQEALRAGSGTVRRSV